MPDRMSMLQYQVSFQSHILDWLQWSWWFNSQSTYQQSKRLWDLQDWQLKKIELNKIDIGNTYCLLYNSGTLLCKLDMAFNKVLLIKLRIYVKQDVKETWL